MSALETGIVDAQDRPIGVVPLFKFDEVQKYLILTRHAYSALGMMMSSAFFEQLSAGNQAIVRKVAAEAVAMQRIMAAEREASMIEELVGRRDGVEHGCGRIGVSCRCDPCKGCVHRGQWRRR